MLRSIMDSNLEAGRFRGVSCEWDWSEDSEVEGSEEGGRLNIKAVHAELWTTTDSNLIFSPANMKSISCDLLSSVRLTGVGGGRVVVD